MKEYMLLYLGCDPHWADASATAKQQAMADWTAWMTALSEKGQLVTGGSPLTYEGKRLTKDGVVTDIVASELKELVTGYSIIRAQDYDQAIQIAKNSPIFRLAGARVEIRAILPM